MGLGGQFLRTFWPCPNFVSFEHLKLLLSTFSLNKKKLSSSLSTLATKSFETFQNFSVEGPEVKKSISYLWRRHLRAKEKWSIIYPCCEGMLRVALRYWNIQSHVMKSWHTRRIFESHQQSHELLISPQVASLTVIHAPSRNKHNHTHTQLEKDLRWK